MSVTEILHGLRQDEKMIWYGRPIPKLHRRGHGVLHRVHHDE